MRQLVKSGVFAAAVVLVLPAWCSFLIKRAVLGPDRA